MPETGEVHDSDELIRLSVFSSIGKSIVAESTITGVLDRVLEQVGAFFGPLNWSALLVDGDRDELVFAVVVGMAAENLVGKRIPIDEGVAGWVVRHGKPAIIETAAADPRFSPRIDALSGFKTESVIAVPLLAGGKVFGVIELLNRLDGRSFSAFDMRVLSTIADFAAIAIEKAYYLSEARRLSEHDHLTEVLNRRGLDRIMEREAARLERYPGRLSVIVADVDGFKAINDRYGHQAGDEVLRSVAACLKRAKRAADSLARYGGDEFVIIMPQTDSEEAAVARARFEELLAKEGRESPIAFSVSLGVHSSDRADFRELFRESDRDLYRRKGEPLALGSTLLKALDDEGRDSGGGDGG
jgi:diguanylate cyclase (GGDEF)-like protein